MNRLLTTYAELTSKMMLIADTINQLNDEQAALSLLPSLTSAQRVRLQDLNSALDSFESYLADLGDIPSEPWLTRALRAA